jgi:NAD(P)-dependent dehydrogenase (short-subunit alcohol dehydrogenase family)
MRLENQRNEIMDKSNQTIDRRNALRGVSVLGASAVAATVASVSSAAAQTAPKTGASTTSSSTRPLAGKVAIVTGARANLGRAFAEGLAKLGADVVVHYHREATRDQAEETARLVRAAGSRGELTVGDLGDAANVKRMFDIAQSRFGGVDILVNNAGMIIKKPMQDVTEAEFDACHRINTKALYLSMQQAATRMRDNGRVITIGTSLLGPLMSGNYSAYNGTKAPAEEFTRGFAREQGGRGITANVIAPGPIDTPFFHGQENAQSTQFATGLAIQRRLGRIDDITPIVNFLASEQSRWVTGQTLWVNGGYLTR